MKISGKKKKSQAIDEIKADDNSTESLKSQLIRSLADYDNLKKRVEAEKEIWFKVASARIVGRIIPILDNLESAGKHLNDQGLAIVISEFRKVINEEGFFEKQIKPDETIFDSEYMEAVEVIDTNDENKNGKVAEVVLTGWAGKVNGESKEMIVRLSKVKVYKLKVEN